MRLSWVALFVVQETSMPTSSLVGTAPTGLHWAPGWTETVCRVSPGMSLKGHTPHASFLQRTSCVFLAGSQLQVAWVSMARRFGTEQSGARSLKARFQGCRIRSPRCRQLGNLLWLLDGLQPRGALFLQILPGGKATNGRILVGQCRQVHTGFWLVFPVVSGQRRCFVRTTSAVCWNGTDCI